MRSERDVASSDTRRRAWRGLFSALALALFGVVSSSFAYGVYLLVKVPRQAQPASARPDPLPADVAALLERGKQHLEEREVEQALVAYRRVLFTGPILEAQLGLAEGERLAGREEVAASEYERVLRLDPGETTALRQLARIRSHRRETWPEAEAHLRAYLGQRGDDAEAQLSLARLLAWQGKAEPALELYERPAVEASLTPGDRRDYAFALVEAGRSGEAEPLLRQLLAAAPGDRDVALTLAGLRAKSGDWDAALPHYRRMLEARPDDARVNLAYGQGLLARNDPRASLVPLEKAARALPTNGEAALAYARAARGAGRLDLAEKEFERAAALDGGAEVARECADLLMQRRRYRRAEPHYGRAYALGLRDERLLLGFGGALAANGKAREAVPLLEQVYARSPSERLAYELARLHRTLGSHERALELLADIERMQGRR
jgi:tetratricopeptide (TPR) repeat protein